MNPGGPHFFIIEPPKKDDLSLDPLETISSLDWNSSCPSFCRIGKSPTWEMSST
jgi:hypothetical protein